MADKVSLRSDFWFGPQAAVDLRAHHTGKLVNSKLTLEELTGTKHPLSHRTESGRRPIIGICKFGGDLNPCQAMHDHHLGDRVADGIRQSGGIPLRFEAAPPLGEPLTRPTSMYLRNLTTLSLIETIIANPLDGLVLLTGCDKTVPAGLMAALTVDLPVIVASAGPMLNGYYRGEQSASGVHLWKNRELLAAGSITEDDLMVRSCAAQPSAGHCMSMGTASTLNCLAEALGMTLTGASAIPAPMSARAAYSFQSGSAIVEAVLNEIRPSDYVTRQSFLNAVAVNAAIGGSTNAVIHLLAAARMAGIDFSLEDWEKGAHVPLLADIKPSGRFLMEEFYRAGGLPAVLRELATGGYIDDSVKTCSGKTLRDELATHEDWTDRAVIRGINNPLQQAAGIVVLKGNLCPDGAVLKISAVSDPALLQHRGPAFVFDDIEDYHRRIDDPAQKITPEMVLVLRNCGPLGYPGMPEVGNVRLPGYLLAQGVTAMVTVSDARMSGTAYGCHILHVSPESAAGGPLGIVRTGDIITLDVKQRTLTLDIVESEFSARMQALSPAPAPIHSPWGVIWQDERLGVHQAHVGAYMKYSDHLDLTGPDIAQRVRTRLRPQH